MSQCGLHETIADRCAMSNQPKPRRYDHVGAWFLTPQASRWGLVFTIIFGVLTAAVAVAK